MQGSGWVMFDAAGSRPGRPRSTACSRCESGRRERPRDPRSCERRQGARPSRRGLRHRRPRHAQTLHPGARWHRRLLLPPDPFPPACPRRSRCLRTPLPLEQTPTTRSLAFGRPSGGLAAAESCPCVKWCTRAHDVGPDLLAGPLHSPTPAGTSGPRPRAGRLDTVGACVPLFGACHPACSPQACSWARPPAPPRSRQPRCLSLQLRPSPLPRHPRPIESSASERSWPNPMVAGRSSESLRRPALANSRRPSAGRRSCRPAWHLLGRRIAAGTTSGSRPSASAATLAGTHVARPGHWAAASTAGAALDGTTSTCSRMRGRHSSRCTMRTSGVDCARAWRSSTPTLAVGSRPIGSASGESCRRSALAGPTLPSHALR
jgi:hypothetical protein